MKPHRRTIHPEVRVMNKDEGIVEFIASDETPDSYCEVIRAAGWRFTQFQNNAPVVDSHDYSSITKLLGTVVDYKVKGDRLIESVKFAIDVPQQPLADLAFRMVDAGYLKACSVGFWPVRMVNVWDQDPKGFQDALKKLKLAPEQLARVERIYLEQEQCELSICILGANPNALAKAHKDGLASDEDLARVGFQTEDEMSFLYSAASEFDEATPAMQRMWSLQLGQITARHQSPSGQHQAVPGPALTPPAARAAEEVTRRSQSRAAFLRELQTHLS